MRPRSCYQVLLKVQGMGNKSKKSNVARRDVFKWTEGMDDVFVDALIEQQRMGNRAKPEAKKWMSSHIAHYDKLLLLFAKDRAKSNIPNAVNEMGGQWAISGSPRMIDGVHIMQNEVTINLEDLNEMNDGTSQLATPVEANSQADSQARSQSATSLKEKKRKASSGDAFEREFKSIREAIRDVADALREGNHIAERGRPHVYSEQEVFAELVKIGVEGNLRYKAYTFLIASAGRSELSRTDSTRIYYKKLPKNRRYPRRPKHPPDFGVNLFLTKPTTPTVPSPTELIEEETSELTQEEEEEENHGEENGQGCDDIVWETEEIEAIKSLFQGRIPQKPGKLNRERPLPLPLPYKLRPLGLPSRKHNIKRKTSPMLVDQIYKNPSALISLAQQIKSLHQDQDVSLILDECARFLRKGSLSLTIRELGHMGLPGRALQTFCWAQKQPHLFPDDRILASTVQVLARNNEMKVPLNSEKFIRLASGGVIEAVVKGLIKGGSLKIAWKLISVADACNRTLSCSIYAKLIWELGKNPDKHVLAKSLLDVLAEREELDLNQQDCTSVMKVCIRLGRFDVVEGLFNWFKQSGNDPSVIMYTTVIHSRYSEGNYKEALALVLEMEGSNCLFDLPAYRVVIKVFVAMNDVSRAARYFSRLKEAGFSPTYDIYKGLITVYMGLGRLAKCREIWKEAEAAGFQFNKEMTSRMTLLERKTREDFSTLKL
ncbi:hypothetical protein Tsubulata_049612 [Turnera subulata]|uniref:Pentatricopeptide repeat-containing protein n=1 Tax=Turnera subulata TaxID=218843 RepID=A0A9Q0J788_9ROSI|nr:hypothetical protein Tsubulata_049612 [Turnera subulata]